jgi:Holliday junction resolvasome RuvABC endonuclease subunit
MSKNKWGIETIPKTICAIDASTNSLAFALFDTQQKTLGVMGKIKFEGNTNYEKVMDACKKSKAFFDYYGGFEAIVIEHTVFMNSPKVAADLALVQGALLGAAGQSGTKVIGTVAPITWQIFIGNGKLTKDEKFFIRSKNPGKSEAWHKSNEREIRKQKTIRFINMQYDKTITDNDVADACGIGHWAVNNWNKALGVDK